MSQSAWTLFAVILACYAAIILARDGGALRSLENALYTLLARVRSSSGPLLVAGVVFLLRLFIGWTVSGPYLAADELGYLGAAQFLSRTGPMYNLAGAAFYPAGYSVLLVPAFVLFELAAGKS